MPAWARVERGCGGVALDRRDRGGGRAPLPADLAARIALRGRARPRCRRRPCRTPARRRTARRSSWPPARTRRSPRRWPSSPRCARSSRPPIEPLGLRAAVTGTHPTARWEHIEVSPGARYRYLHASMRELARREPTFGLHVHVAVPDPEAAVRAYNAMRTHLPMLLALSGNSPYWQGRDSGLVSARTPAFQAFPRTGIPRRFSSWREYVRGGRHPAAQRRDPRADVPVVGRTAAAEVRHARGARARRADERRRHRRAGRARAVPRPPRGARRPARSRRRRGARGPGREPLHRLPRRHAGRADRAAGVDAPPGRRPARRPACTPAPRTPGRSAASRSWPASRPSPARRERRASGRSRPRRAGSKA